MLHPFAFIRRKAARRESMSRLSSEQCERLQTMQREGCVPATLDMDSALLKEVYTELQERARGFSFDTKAGKGKNFWEHLELNEDSSSTSAIVRYALQPKTIDMAAAYLGEAPYIALIGVLLSHGTENDSWQESQLWHRDYDDRKMVRFFTYCTDVKDERDGMFTFIPKHISKKVKNTFFPSRITDDAMDEQGYLKDAKSIGGPAGTCFYVDTRNCYHLGSRVALGHTRIALLVTYLTYASQQPFDNHINICHQTTKMEQFALRCF